MTRYLSTLAVFLLALAGKSGLGVLPRLTKLSLALLVGLAILAVAVLSNPTMI